MSEGIFGVVDFQRSLDSPGELARSLNAYLGGGEGGEKGCSYARGPGYILGMRREPRGDPMQQMEVAEVGTFQGLCVIHGEIHDTDTRVADLAGRGYPVRGDLDLVLCLYRERGPRFAKGLNGLFCIGLLDLEQRRFLLVNDRFGLARQVYWTRVGSRFCFATHLKTLLACPGVPRTIDRQGLNLFLKYSYIPSPRTIFQGIRKLPPAHLLIFQNGRVTEEEYWGFPDSDGDLPDLNEAVSEYRDRLRESIRKRIRPASRVGILLSGGLDSSANVALAAQCTREQLKTFSVGFQDPAFDERPYSRIVAERFGTEHFEYTITGKEIEDLPKLIWNLEEPYFEFGLFLTYLGMAAAAGGVDIVLGGEGADQLFGTGGFAGGRPVALRYLLLRSHTLGLARKLFPLLRGSTFYEHDNAAFKLRLLWGRVVDLNDWYFYGYDERELRDLYRNPDWAAIPPIFPDARPARPVSFPALYRETQINQDILHYVNENVMVKSGRMADMLGLALRESYLDVDVADFLVSLDYRLKRSGDVVDHLRGKIQTKVLHRRAMVGVLPEEILKKPKQGGFVPVMIFLKDPRLRERIYDHLLRSDVMRAYFRTEYLEALFRRYEALQGGRMYWHNFYNAKANRILFLLTFEIWHRFYMDGFDLGMTPPPLTEYLNGGRQGKGTC